MIYFDRTPNALSDDSLEGKIGDTLLQMRKFRDHLQSEIEDEIANSVSLLRNMHKRMKFAFNGGSASLNRLGEFQTCISHRLDLFIMQYGLVSEIIEQLEKDLEESE